MDYAGRRDRLWAAVAAADCDAILVSRLIHVRYLCGFSGSNGALLLTVDGAILFTDGRYLTQAAAEAPDVAVVRERAVVPAGVAAARARGCRRLAVEGEWLSADALNALAGLEIGIVPQVGWVEELRLLKDDGEIAAIAEACAITDAALADLWSEGLAGRSERDLAGRLEHLFRLHGAEDRAFESIVATGPNSAVPHHQPTDRLVAPGDLVKIDCGARVAGYHADETRTVVVGAPAVWQRELHELVLAAQIAGRAALMAGADPMVVDAAARSVVAAAGLGEAFLHPLGHAVGLEIHERPFLGRPEGILRPRMPVTVEPGVYLAGRGGVRIEDTILITEDGQQSLTNLTRELLEL